MPTSRGAHRAAERQAGLIGYAGAAQPCEYDAAGDIKAMVKASLIAEQVAIEAMNDEKWRRRSDYAHAAGRHHGQEEEHADDMRDLLA